MTRLSFLTSGALTLSLLILSGCSGGLNVNVDVLDKTYMDSMVGQDTIRSEAMKLSNGNFQQTAKFMAETTNLLSYYRHDGCYDEAEKTVAPLLPVLNEDTKKNDRKIYLDELQQARSGHKELSHNISKELSEMSQWLYGEDNRVQFQLNKNNYGAALWDTYRKKQLPPQMLELLMQRRAFIGEAKEHRTRLLAQIVQECRGEIIDDLTIIESRGLANAKRLSLDDLFMHRPKLVSNIKRKWAEALDFNFTPNFSASTRAAENSLEKRLFGGGSLLATQEGIYHVVNAEKRYWAPTYNEAFGRGMFGSTSTAIKINGLADYTVKGFSFDGRSTASMVRKLGLTSVGFAAAMSGVPIDLTSNGTAKPDPVFEGTTVSNAQTEIATSAATTKVYQNSIKRIARKILTYETDLSIKYETSSEIDSRIDNDATIASANKPAAKEQAKEQQAARVRAQSSVKSTFEGYKTLLSGKSSED